MKLALDRRHFLKRLSDWSQLSRIAEFAGIDRTSCALGAPWFLIGVVGMLGVAWALRDFQESIAGAGEPSQQQRMPIHATKIPAVAGSETKVVGESIDGQEIAESSTGEKISVEDERKRKSRSDAGEKAMREIIARRNAAEDASKRSKQPVVA